MNEEEKQAEAGGSSQQLVVGLGARAAMKHAAQDDEGQEETEGAVRAAPMTTAW
ncbi:hypothetical protein PR002_g16014 [Phytophthora rubi]|uniref:Uncharacterized protein n=1 Tax=Phytophthora rubi TaxID=129364 RepID=A0A6A3KRN8_9STRA|nr:hypothetical protein PR002_g16014 [Phytophthora rubi]